MKTNFKNFKLQRKKWWKYEGNKQSIRVQSSIWLSFKGSRCTCLATMNGGNRTCPAHGNGDNSLLPCALQLRLHAYSEPSCHLSCLAIGTGETLSTSVPMSPVKPAIPDAGVSPMVLAGSTTCLHKAHIVMHAGEIGLGLRRKQTPSGISLERNLYGEIVSKTNPFASIFLFLLAFYFRLTE